LPYGTVTQFRIPDDIPEWEFLSGGGGLDYTVNNGPNNFAYDLVPIHRLHEHLDDVPELDHTKFASYDRNILFLHYVLITYAPWTGFGEDLRINYYNLNLKFTLTADDSFVPSITQSYTINPGTFNLPNYFKIFNDNVLEMKEFPLQAGDRNEFTRTVTFKIKGLTNVPVVQPEQNIFARKGSFEKYGFVSMLSEDSNYLQEEDGVLYYHPNRAPHFTSTGLAGFDIHPRSGRWVFDQNVSSYAGLTDSQLLDVSVTVFVMPDGSPEGSASLEQVINFQIFGTDSNYVSNIVEAPEALPFEYIEVEQPPSNSYDPDEYIEDETLVPYALQEFEEIEVFIPFPAADDDGSAFGWQGQNPVFSFEEVEDPDIVLSIEGANSAIIYTQADDNRVTSNDFTFNVVTSDGPVPSTGEGGGYLVRFKPNNKNFDFLHGTETLHITYAITARYNEAPYVGNFEDLNEFQRKSLRASAIYHADPSDWRYDIFNPVSEPQYDGYVYTTGDSALRDTIFSEINISPSTLSVSGNYLHEFKLGNTDPKEDLLEIDQGFLNYTSRLRYEFDEESEELLFYDKNLDADPTVENPPLSTTQALAIVYGSKSTPKSRYFSIAKSLPSGFDRDDISGNSWRKHIESREVYAYLVYGYLPV
jgi:hypothetical protein